MNISMASESLDFLALGVVVLQDGAVFLQTGLALRGYVEECSNLKI